MTPKKYDKAKLENKRSIFLQTGLIITLGLILAAFEWTSKPNHANDFKLSDYSIIEEEHTQITRPEELKPPPPKPRPKDVINIISNTDEITEEYLGEDIEPEPFQEIDFGLFIEQPEEVDETPFIVVENMPTFKGKGLLEFRHWVMKNLRYPEIAAENGISGRVIVQFVVGFYGDIEDVVIIRGADPSLDKEAVRVVSSSPKWTPGKQRGKPARVLFTLPINFVLQ